MVVSLPTVWFFIYLVNARRCSCSECSTIWFCRHSAFDHGMTLKKLSKFARKIAVTKGNYSTMKLLRDDSLMSTVYKALHYSLDECQRSLAFYYWNCSTIHQSYKKMMKRSKIQIWTFWKTIEKTIHQEHHKLHT